MFSVRCVFFPLFSLCGELLFSQRCAQSNGAKECDPMREYERSFYSLFSGLLPSLPWLRSAGIKSNARCFFSEKRLRDR